VECHSSGSIIEGNTYGQWTVKWWDWALSARSSVNPVVDRTGEFAGMNQPNVDVWFLAGKFAETCGEYPSRKAEIPKERNILFPILNCAASRLEYPGLNDTELIEHVSKDMETIIKRDCFINGIRVNPERVCSDPKIFPLYINDVNPIGVIGGSTYAAADGYWIFLKPVTKGEYSISIEGSCESGRLKSGATYKLIVV
jgi:hypothetical protein